MEEEKHIQVLHYKHHPTQLTPNFEIMGENNTERNDKSLEIPKTIKGSRLIILEAQS
jgi:hypothetical protein